MTDEFEKLEASLTPDEMAKFKHAMVVEFADKIAAIGRAFKGGVEKGVFPAVKIEAADLAIKQLLAEGKADLLAAAILGLILSRKPKPSP